MRILWWMFPFLAVILILPRGSMAEIYPLEKANVVANGGGGPTTNGTGFLHGTVGQSCIGVAANPTYRNLAGFWHVVDQTHIGPTSAVAITSFEVAFSMEGVTLAWIIGSADDLAGVNVYRSIEEDAGFVRINKVLIPAGRDSEYLDRDVQPGEEYFYRIGAVDRDGEFFSRTASVQIPLGEMALYQNVPNPFNPSTTISFYLPEPTRVVLTIYDVLGGHVRTLLDEDKSFGLHEVVWDARDSRGDGVSTGVYFYRLQTGGKVLTKKLTVLK